MEGFEDKKEKLEEQMESLPKGKVICALLRNKEEILSWCFEALIRELEGKSYDYTPDIVKDLKKRNAKVPFFVKWLRLYDPANIGKQDSHFYELKGCIGCLAESEICELKYYALQSALHDSRFDQITTEDIPYLMVTVTYLFNFEKCKNSYDWDIGKHGIKLKFSRGGKNYSATFLPEVALQNNFSHRKTIRKLIRKANYFGEINEKLIKEVEVQRYEGVSCSLTYLEYQNFLKTNQEKQFNLNDKKEKRNSPM